MGITNAERLTAGRKAAEKKRKARQNQIPEIKWDENARREYLTGFHKRKQQRLKKAKELALERARQERIAERKQRREAAAAVMEERMKAIRQQQHDGDDNDEKGLSGSSSSIDGGSDGEASTAQPKEYRTQTTITTVAMDAGEKATVGADKFVDLYYRLMDSDQRQHLLSLYKDNTAIVWNGNPYQGTQLFSQFLQQLPRTRHELHAYNSQPLISGGVMEGLLVTVNGLVRYADDPPRFLHQQFILNQDPNKPGTYYVSSDCMRFT